MTTVPVTRAIPTQAPVGLVLAGAIIGAWIALHVAAVFVVGWTPVLWLVAAPVVVIVQCWLSVGLFIIAHDCMHGSLVPGRRRANHTIGQLCLALYAGFSFARLNAKHHEHHAHAGTAEDPDFDEEPPHGFWHWYARFIGEYFGWREYAVITAMFVGYVLLTGAAVVNVLAFWALPSILASLQLFYFGTYLPHRPGGDAFADRHRTRSNDYSWVWSFLTCFHFGYHHEHHEYPFLPWWRLPEAREA